MNGIYPNFTGLDSEPSLSLYPDWLGEGDFEVIIEEPEGGGGSKGKRDQIDKLRDTAIGRQQLREDEEILAIIMVAMRTLQ